MTDRAAPDTIGRKPGPASRTRHREPLEAQYRPLAIAAVAAAAAMMQERPGARREPACVPGQTSD